MPLTGNDTVLISMWRDGGVHSNNYHLVIIAVMYTYKPHTHIFRPICKSSAVAEMGDRGHNSVGCHSSA